MMENMYTANLIYGKSNGNFVLKLIKLKNADMLKIPAVWLFDMLSWQWIK